MNRISREQMFMDICDVIAKRSTCGRQNVGALLTFENRIVSIGYNGPPSKQPHCQGEKCKLTEAGGCASSIHAEDNAIRFLPKTYANKTLTLYCSLSPCVTCAQKIIDQKNIRQVFYRQEYRIKTGIESLSIAMIPVFRITPAGFLINARTNEFIQGQVSNS